MKRCVFVALVSVALFVTNSNADIKNWQTGQTLPGSEGITPGPGIDLRNWNLSSKNLKYANLAGMDLRNSIFLNSWLDNASFSGSHLANANFYVARLSAANLTGTNLTNASFLSAQLQGANLTDAVVNGANFSWAGLTSTQLYSTASYKSKDLSGIILSNNDMMSCDFSQQNLTHANLEAARFILANFTGTNLTHANLRSTDFSGAVFGGANLTNAVVNQASFVNSTSKGLTSAQFYSTASYKNKDLSGIRLWSNDLSGWNFSGQNLAGASFSGSTLDNADFRKAAGWDPASSLSTRNTIRANGEIRGLNLLRDEVLLIRNADLAIRVTQGMTMAEGAGLRFVFDGTPWGSTVKFADGVVPELGGVLELVFADGVDIASLFGTTFKLFDWNELLAEGQTFSEIVTLPGLMWDSRTLYTTGEITLIPEPCSAALTALGVLALLKRRQRRRDSGF